MTLTNDVLTAERLIISVMGPHAGEEQNEIFSRKINDITKIGQTFWLHRSYLARPDNVQRFFKSDNTIKFPIVFIAPSSKNGAQPTKETNAASRYSSDKVSWNKLPTNLSPVTGNLKSDGYALTLSNLKLIDDVELDIWQYSDGNNEKDVNPLIFKLGASTCISLKNDLAKHPSRMKKRFRQIVAVGELCSPYSVWLR